MKQSAFEERYASDWQGFEAWLAYRDKHGRRSKDDAPAPSLADEQVRVVVPSERHLLVKPAVVRLLQFEDELAGALGPAAVVVLLGLGVEVPPRAHGVVPARRAVVAFGRPLSRLVRLPSGLVRNA